jgi:uncharacterized peroxidase-related enzyme
MSRVELPPVATDGPMKGMKLNFFRLIQNSKATEAFFGESKKIQALMTLTAAEREAIAMLVSEYNGCDYCLSAHAGLGKQAGLDAEALAAARKGESSDPKMQTLLTYTRLLLEKKGHVSDQDLEDLKAAGYGEAEIIEIPLMIGIMTYNNMMNLSTALDNDLPAAPGR